jgi:hypothetical protein
MPVLGCSPLEFTAEHCVSVAMEICAGFHFILSADGGVADLARHFSVA